jgi:PAS domain S-box-containing protein
MNRRYLHYFAVLTLGLGMAAAIRWEYESDLDDAKENYRHESEAKFAAAAHRIEMTFAQIYQGLRTIALLPGVRSIDRSANNFNADARRTVQEIYNNTALNFPLSEIYIVPVGFDPDEIDLRTGKLQTPIVTFDELIVGRSADSHKRLQSSKADSPSKLEPLEEIEIYEYRLMKRQLAWLSEHYPTRDHISGLAFPAICGPEVITCDNSRYSRQRPNDADRSGLVYSVPFYGPDGRLKGMISAVILTPALRDLLHQPFYAARNLQYDYTITPGDRSVLQASRKWLARGEPDPYRLYSTVRELPVIDGGGKWLFWVAQPDELFWQRLEVTHIRYFVMVGYLSSIALVLGLWTFLFVVRRYQHKIEQHNETLTDQVRESEEKYRHIINAAADAIISIDAQGAIVELNRAAERMFGFKKAELVGKPLTSIMPERFRTPHLSAIQRYFTTGQRCLPRWENLELPGLTKGGQEIPLEISFSLFESGDKKFLTGVLRDITARKQTEETLVKLSSAVEQTADSMMITNTRGVIEYVNPAFEKLTGYAKEEVLGKTPAILNSGKHDRRFFHELWETILSGRTYRNVLINKRKNGDLYYAEKTITPIRDAQANITHFVSTDKDITERKRMEEALRESEERFKAFMNNSPVVAFMKDEDGRFIYLNEPFKRIFQTGPDDLLGKTDFDLFPAETARQLRENDAAILATDKTVELMETVPTPDGAPHYWLAFKFPVKDISGRQFLGGVAVDLTERKQAEERLTKMNECFLNFGADPLENINRLTALCGELLGAACALYNRLDRGMVNSWGQWNTPPDFNPIDKPDGHICYDVIKRGDDEALVVRNLPETHYAQTDPNVIPYSLQTYIGQGVKFGGVCVGSLCVVYQSDFIPSENDKKLLGIIASAIGVEERRKRVEEERARLTAILEATTDFVAFADAQGHAPMSLTFL